MPDEYDDAKANAEYWAEGRRMKQIWLALGLLLIGCGGLGAYALFSKEPDETFNFIALLIIFMTALAASSIIFVALKMGSRDEAFGLPSGSIRALIAIGIMILFVVFGLPVVSSEPKEISTRPAMVATDQVAEIVRLNQEQGLVVRVLGSAGGQTRLEIVQMSNVTDAQMDLNKQMLTAIITLLTTVIGFYFGSRSATDGMASAPSVVTTSGGDSSTTVTTDPVVPPGGAAAGTVVNVDNPDNPDTETPAETTTTAGDGTSDGTAGDGTAVTDPDR